MTPGQVEAVGNDVLSEYEEARRALAALRKQLFGIGDAMMAVGMPLKNGSPLLEHHNERWTLETACRAFASFEVTLGDYRATRERAADAYKCLRQMGRESIKDLSEFPVY